MDTAFWLGIGMGALVGIPISIVANLWTDPVRGFLDRRRTIQLSRQKDKELGNYYFARAILDGDEAAKAHLNFRQTFAVHSAVFSALYLLVGLMAGLGMYAGGYVEVLKLTFVKVLIMVWAIGGNYLAIHSIISFLNTWRVVLRLRNFSRYEASIIEKWGEPENPSYLR
ncbi:hypothetical protein IVB08_26615 [Bradyrhizobium sp. 173]|uniref:hypothetical protein n=1 Tax=Bradyrhizobium sp. 173 TaxID=2782644 RepID=UPI001FFB0B33|nr:hypothetical protein [Bradyrhizobium sp. 173]MCK1567488.1 hypothetical protein [Bradyrhizobium sp. 173]